MTLYVNILNEHLKIQIVMYLLLWTFMIVCIHAQIIIHEYNYKYTGLVSSLSCLITKPSLSFISVLTMPVT